MSEKHTLGPWSYHQAQTSPLSKIHAYEISTPAFDVASATPHVGIRREADARLMAAAPDLLEALELCLEELDSCDPEFEGTHYCGRCDSAIDRNQEIREKAARAIAIATRS